MRILAIDQGTTNTKALVIDEAGQILARASAPSTSHYPHPGWAEQSAQEIWASTKHVIDAVANEVGADSIAALAITNQRETIVAWNAETGEPVAPAILWQCTRSAEACEALIAAGQNQVVEDATGLTLNPMFPASKIAWLMANNAEARQQHAQGNLRIGTVDSWLLWNLTGGEVFATDHSNASRTQLLDTSTMQWSEALGDIFDAPVDCLPALMASDARFGQTASGCTALPAGVPIHAMMGDSHAALYGHGIRNPGVVKATYGTGSSLMTLTDKRVRASNGVSSTVAWTDSAGTAFALEGNIFVSAQSAAFVANLLGLDGAAALSELAQTVESAEGVTFVPALSGLGAPHWSTSATGTIAGMTHGTSPAHVARATFDAIAHQIADVFDAMAAAGSLNLTQIRADGGATVNTFLMALQADILGHRVERSSIEEVGALGAARMAFAALGLSAIWESQVDTFDPTTSEDARKEARDLWHAAINRVIS